MKNVFNLASVFIGTLILLIIILTCSVDPAYEAEVFSVLTHFAGTLSYNDEQVWVPNYYTGKLSSIFNKFLEDRNINVVVYLPEYEGENIVDYEIIQTGTGEIKNGKLGFSVEPLDDNYLLTSEELLSMYFFGWSFAGSDVKINNPQTKGNIITVKTETGEGLIKEGFSGTGTYLSGEYIYFIYVNNNCRITATSGNIGDIFYTYNAFDLELKQGWNTITKTESYTTEGHSTYSMAVKNPGLRWLMLPLQ